MKFPVIRQKFPDPRNIFPVNFLREFVKSRCSTAAFRYEIGSQSSRIAKFPAKFPVSRESAWRRVRSALRCQPGSAAPRDFVLSNARNARQWGAAHAVWLINVPGGAVVVTLWPLRGLKSLLIALQYHHKASQGKLVPRAEK
jgi:hypothetical protein